MSKENGWPAIRKTVQRPKPSFIRYRFRKSSHKILIPELSRQPKFPMCIICPSKTRPAYADKLYKRIESKCTLKNGNNRKASTRRTLKHVQHTRASTASEVNRPETRRKTAPPLQKNDIFTRNNLFTKYQRQLLRFSFCETSYVWPDMKAITCLSSHTRTHRFVIINKRHTACFNER